MKVLITGGHLTPALAVLEELKDCDIVFVGRKFALSSDTKESFEYKEIKRYNVRFVNLNAGRVSHLFNWRSALNVLKIPEGFIAAMGILNEEKPDVVLSFGGYIGLPIAFCAALKKIPLIIHEQTMHPGRANRYIGSLAQKVLVAFPDTQTFFPAGKTTAVGNPVRASILKVDKAIPGFKKTKPVLFITGGSLGSHDLNVHIFAILPDLLKTFIVIHQTGSVTEFGDFEKTQAFKMPNYFPFTHLHSDLIGFAYKQADIVISRAGANTISELLALKKPSILVPLPWSAFNEQQKHAKFMQSLGIAEVFDQSKNPQDLLEMIRSMVGALEKYRKNFDTINLPYDSAKAAKQIAKEVLALAA